MSWRKQKHPCLCFHYWDYLTNFWRNNWSFIIDVLSRKTRLKMMLEKWQKNFAFLLPPVYWLKLKKILLWLHCGTIIPKRDYKNILIDFANKLLKTDNCWQKKPICCVWVRFLKKRWLFFIILIRHGLVYLLFFKKVLIVGYLS